MHMMAVFDVAEVVQTSALTEEQIPYMTNEHQINNICISYTYHISMVTTIVIIVVTIVTGILNELFLNELPPMRCPQ